MPETTQINKFRQKRLRTLNNKTQEKSVNSFLYPKNNLYNRREFELLDTIYSDEPPTIQEAKQEIVQIDNFWPENKEDYLALPNQKNNIFSNITWFVAGVMITSVVWFIYFQIYVHQIRIKNDTQIVFQSTANIMTDKNIDTEPKWFSSKSQKTEIKPATKPASVQSENEVKYHTVRSGDSLWTVANKYYPNPSPDNINKIAKANDLKITSILQLGQKLTIPE